MSSSPSAGPRERRRRAPTRTFTHTPPPPYSLELTVARLVLFSEAVDHWHDGVYTRLLFVGGAPVIVRISQEGPPGRARLRVELHGRGARDARAVDAARHLLDRALGAGTDVRAFYRAIREDPLLGSTVRAFRGLRVAGWPGLFESITTVVISQQINLRFAYSVRDGFVAKFGARARWRGVTYHAFPTVRRVMHEPLESLLTLRLSRAKARTILSVAETLARGEFSEAKLAPLPDEEVVEKLTAIKGIGRWTAETVLLRGLGRLDAFPAADLGVVKYLAQGLLGRRTRATEAEMRALAERWRPYRGLALVYAYGELARRREPKVRGATTRKRREAR